jgi:hypothetical protein
MEENSSFISIFNDLDDPRLDRKKKHLLIDVLVIALCGVLCGADSLEGMEDVAYAKQDWLKHFLQLPHGIPSYNTIAGVFSLIDPQHFQKCFIRWVSTVIPKLNTNEVIAIDGKSVRAASKKAKESLHMITAFATQAGLVMSQMKS